MVSIPDRSQFENPPSLCELISIAEALADMQRLITIDGVWTAAGGEDLAAAECQALITLGRQIDDQIAVVERHAFKLQHIFSMHSPWVNGRIAKELGASHALNPSQRDATARFLDASNDDFAMRGAEIFGYLSKQAPAERVEMRRKISELESRGKGATDMSQEFACGVLAGMVATGLLTCLETVGTGCLVAGMAAGAGLALCE